MSRSTVPLTRRVRPGRVALIAVVVLVTIWMLAPTMAVVPLSFVGTASFRLPPESWSTKWYSNLAEDNGWLQAFLTSLLVAGLATVLATVAGTAAALGARGRFVGRQLVSMVLMAPMIVPLVVFAIGVYAVFLPWGLTGTIPGFVAAHAVLGIPYVFVTVSAALQGLDDRLTDAANSLGASPSKAFWVITMPLIAPSVMTGALFAFMTSFDETVISIFLVTPSMRTLPVGMYESVTREIDPTVAVIATIIFTLTTLLLILGVLVQARRQTSNG